MQTFPKSRYIIPAVNPENYISSADNDDFEDPLEAGLDGDGLGSDDFNQDDSGDPESLPNPENESNSAST